METIKLNDTAEFANFVGTENLYKHPFGFVFTDGIKHLADTFGCYWLLDTIIAHQQGKLAKQPFQTWTLRRKTKGEDRFAITVSDGNHNILQTISLSFSDFKAGEVEVWFTDRTILLPSEY